MIGNFDGKVFTPETKFIVYNHGNSFVAAQSFNDLPESDKRHISLAFTYNGVIPAMPFNVTMLFPVEKKLLETKYGLRVCPTPIKEIELLHDKSVRFANKSVKEINDYFKDHSEIITGEMRIKMKLKNISHKLSMQINGAKITIDPKRDSLFCTGELKPPAGPFPRAGTYWQVRINENGEAGSQSLLPLNGLELKEYLANLEKDLIEQALDDSAGVVARAADRLHIRRTTLVEKMRKYSLQKNSPAAAEQIEPEDEPTENSGKDDAEPDQAASA